MENMGRFICVGVYFILLIIWIIAAFYGNKRYAEYVKPLNKKKFLFKTYYVVGLAILEWIKYPFDFEIDKKRIKQAQIIYGKKFADYYYRINVAEKVTYAYTIIMISLLFYPILNDPIFILAGLFAAGILVYYTDTKIVSVIDEQIGRASCRERV